MAGLSNITEIARQALLLSQSALQTTSKNIANINTDGYSRQRLDIFPILPEILAGFGLGSAINGDTLRRIRDDFIDRQYWTQNGFNMQYETESNLLLQIEGVLPTSSDAGIRKMLDEFWIAWDNLSNDPESPIARTLVKSRAVILTASINRAYAGYVSFQDNLKNDIQNEVTSLNTFTRQLAELNRLNPGNNLDLEDQRDRILDKISGLANISVQRNGGSLSVFVGGIALVSGTKSYDVGITTEFDANGVGSIKSTIAGSDQEVFIDGGTIGASITVHTQDVQFILNRLDTMATTLVTKVNAIHRTGYNNSDVTGIDFFDPNTTGANNIAISDAIKSSHEFIATSDVAGETGNSTIARALSALGDTPVIGDQTIDGYYRSTVAYVGDRVQNMRFLSESQRLVVDHLNTQRLSISGVSMEEEMTKMVQLEQSFAAAARIVSTVDEMVRNLMDLI